MIVDDGVVPVNKETGPIFSRLENRLTVKHPVVNYTYIHDDDMICPTIVTQTYI